MTAFTDGFGGHSYESLEGWLRDNADRIRRPGERDDVVSGVKVLITEDRAIQQEELERSKQDAASRTAARVPR